MKLQINKCFTCIFELYLTDSFQREVIHSSGGCESSKNKIIDMNINWWIRNIRPNYCISEFKCNLNSNRLSFETCNVFRVIIILYTIDLYVVLIPQNDSKWNKIVSIQTMFNPKILCLPPIANTLRALYMRFTWVELIWYSLSVGSYDGCDQTVTINTTWNQDIDPISGLVASPWKTRFLPYLQWTTQPGDVYTLIVYDAGFGPMHGVYTNINGNDISTATVINLAQYVHTTYFMSC